jgi:type VI secretion system FHA domain protein
MVVVIRAINYKGLPPSQPITAQFDIQGGSIGRAPNNQLILPDPDKFVSRVHATVIYEAGQYFIQDSSTGGTFFNDSELPLQQSRIPLMDGAKLRIGEYELLVSIAESPTLGLAINIEQPVRQLDFAQGSSMLDGPFAAVQPAPPAAKPDFYSSFIEQPESSSIHQSFTPPSIADSASNTVDDLDFGDLLSKLEELPGGSVAAHVPPSADLPTLPADFFADDFAASASVPEMAEAPFPAVPAVEIPAEPVEQSQSLGWPQTEFEPEPVAAVFFPDTAQQVISPAQKPETVQPEFYARVTEQPVSAQITPNIPAQTVTSLPANDTLLREFLAGAGIHDPHFLHQEQWPAMMRTSGELLRSMVQGLMQVLRARAELKSQFRVSVTTMRSVDNNPLKFTPNVDDALKLILAPTNPGFLPPKQAVSEGFNDIMNHQLAMTAGIQAALAEVLHSFDPQLIEKSQTEGVLFQKKAKCWEYYLEKYPQLKAVAQEEFFGDAFVDAYEKQMLLLSRATKNQ